MKICLIIINYNGYKYLSSYLQNIDQCCKSSSIDLFITDDNSTDNSISFLLENKYDFTINKGLKKGFAANVNCGIRYAAKKKSYDYFIISNNDIELDKNFFSFFLKVFPSAIADFGKIGLFGFIEYNKDYSNELQNYYLSLSTIISYKEVDHIPGFYFGISSDLLNSIGYLDEDYFMYGEDNDYYRRAIIAKFKILQFNLPVLHYSEGSSEGDIKTSWFAYRNALLVEQKVGNIFTFILKFFQLLTIIINPFYKNNSPSSIRIRRNGLLINLYLLVKSLFWNIGYHVKNKIIN